MSVLFCCGICSQMVTVLCVSTSFHSVESRCSIFGTIPLSSFSGGISLSMMWLTSFLGNGELTV